MVGTALARDRASTPTPIGSVFGDNSKKTIKKRDNAIIDNLETQTFLFFFLYSIFLCIFKITVFVAYKCTKFIQHFQ
jgi:hypothetical protein